MTYIERLPLTFTGDGVSDLPIYTVDPILNAGSMFLVEPARTWPSGIPANGAFLPNLADEKLAARGLATGGLEWVFDAGANDGVHSILERSAKGGIHNIISQADPPASGVGAALLFPAWFADYIVANPTHSFGWSIWKKVTRQGPTQYAHAISQMSGVSSSVGISNAPYLGITGADAIANGRYVRNATPASPVAADMAQVNRRGALSFGRRSNFNGSLVNHPSYVIYRMTLEDLTVSGRTYQAFIDADEVLRQAAFASGGRYAGDSYTAPSTLA